MRKLRIWSHLLKQYLMENVNGAVFSKHFFFLLDFSIGCPEKKFVRFFFHLIWYENFAFAVLTWIRSAPISWRWEDILLILALYKHHKYFSFPSEVCFYTKKHKINFLKIKFSSYVLMFYLVRQEVTTWLSLIWNESAIKIPDTTNIFIPTLTL